MIGSELFLHHIVIRDQRLMLRVHRWPAPRWLRLWMIYATRGGDGWLWYFVAALLLILGGDQRLEALGAQATASAISIVVFMVLKKWTRRRRPCHIEPHCWATLLPPDKFSFPSGHSMTAASCSVVLGFYFPPLLPALAFCALSIAASRVLLGLHFLSDVIVGLLLGVVIGYSTVSLLL